MAEAPDDRPAPSAPSAVTGDVVQGEMRDLVRAHERLRRQLPRALLVGILAGLCAVAFRAALSLAERLRGGLVGYAHTHGPWGFLLLPAFGATFAGLSVLLVRRVAPEASGSGVVHLKVVLHLLRPMAWRRIVPVKFAGGVAGIGAGL